MIYEIAQKIGQILDMVGVVVILAGVIIATCIVLLEFYERKDKDQLYRDYRKGLGRSILLGLEFLIAGDIIRSVTGTPSFTSVAVLGIIVLIRSFLGITFEMEVDGRWPWQRKN